MPQSCVAALCSRGTKDGVSLHAFPKDAVLRKLWTRAVRVHWAKWDGSTERSTLCSLNFAKDCYEQEAQLRIRLGPSRKKLILKPGSLPTFFPSARDETSGSMAWCLESIHRELFASAHVQQRESSSDKMTFRKRQRSLVYKNIYLLSSHLIIIW